MSIRFHMGRITFGPERPSIDVLPGKMDRLAPREVVQVMSPDDVRRLAMLQKELEKLRGERARLINTLLLAEAALTRADAVHPDTLFVYVRDRCRLVLREWRKRA